MKNKKKAWIIGIVILLLLLIFFTIFYLKTAKKSKIGNTSSSQEIVEKILTISEYEAEIEVEVTSNKNKNQYKIKQQYISPDQNMQEVLEPSNIAGVKIIRIGNELKLENTNLNLSSIFENYQYLSDNLLDLSCFIENYKNSKKSEWKEEANQIIMTTEENYLKKTLLIDKTTNNPTKMEIKDTNKNTSVYILYSKVNYKN